MPLRGPAAWAAAGGHGSSRLLPLRLTPTVTVADSPTRMSRSPPWQLDCGSAFQVAVPCWPAASPGTAEAGRLARPLRPLRASPRTPTRSPHQKGRAKAGGHLPTDRRRPYGPPVSAGQGTRSSAGPQLLPTSGYLTSRPNTLAGSPPAWPFNGGPVWITFFCPNTLPGLHLQTRWLPNCTLVGPYAALDEGTVRPNIMTYVPVHFRGCACSGIYQRHHGVVRTLVGFSTNDWGSPARPAPWNATM